MSLIKRARVKSVELLDLKKIASENKDNIFITIGSQDIISAVTPMFKKDVFEKYSISNVSVPASDKEPVAIELEDIYNLETKFACISYGELLECVAKQIKDCYPNDKIVVSRISPCANNKDGEVNWMCTGSIKKKG